MYVIGFDIGGTKIEASLFEFSDREAQGSLEMILHERKLKVHTLSTVRVATERDRGYAHVLERLCYVCREVLKQAGIGQEQLDGVGLALPGTLDPQSGIMSNGNSSVFVGRNVACDLKTALEIKCEVKSANDANLFALAEVMAGAGVDHAREYGIPTDKQLGIGIILGTGVGAGFVLNGKIYEGRRGAAAEAGHTKLNNQNDPCYCGRTGCAELYLSGTGIERQYRLMFKENLTGKDIFERFRKNDHKANELMELYSEMLGDFLCNLGNLFDPDYFVLGGGVSTQKSIYEQLGVNLRKSFFVKNSNLRVYQNRRGDSAGALGAGLMFL